MLLAEGARQFSLRGRGRNLSPFLRRRRRRRDRPHSRGRGIFALGGREPCKRGYKTPWAGFLYPLLRLPLIVRRLRLPAVARLKAKESTDFTSVLSFFCVPWLCDCVVCRA